MFTAIAWRRRWKNSSRAQCRQANLRSLPEKFSPSNAAIARPSSRSGHGGARLQTRWRSPASWNVRVSIRYRITRPIPCYAACSTTDLPGLISMGIGLDATKNCALIDASGEPSARIFAIGPLTRAAFWEIVAVPDIRTQCHRLTEHICAQLPAA